MNAKGRLFGSCFALTLAIAACSEPPPGGRAAAAPQAPAAATPKMAAQPAAPAVTASASPAAQAIDAAVFSAQPNPPAQPADPASAMRVMIKTQVLLDRARFSPGVIDGKPGENVRQALAAFQAARGLAANGQLDEATWTALNGAGAGPIMQDYTITEADVAGPFTPTIPKDYAEMAKLKRLGYATPAEMLAERFHMDEALLKSLNPDADFGAAGTVIVAAAPGDDRMTAEVARIEVDKAEREVRAYGADDALLAVYPATVGSTDRPAPSGEWAVNAVAPDPTWNYDPKRLTFGKVGEKLTIAAGPNNPVGSMWIDLTKDTYGIHGAPEPRLVGKVDSHGCVRLTNWDVNELGAAVKKGAKVVFVGAETKTGAKA